MADSTKTGGVSVTSTTPNATSITVPDVDYVYLLAIKDLTFAISKLAEAMNK